MQKITGIILTSVFVIVVGWAGSPAHAVRFNAEPAVRFAPLHIYLDCGSQSLGAYQFELKAASGRVKIVGVEGGQHPAFAEAPYYDPAALANDRIIVAAFSTVTPSLNTNSNSSFPRTQTAGKYPPNLHSQKENKK